MEERNAVDMVKENQRIRLSVRGHSTCQDCEERFIACSDNCPKDKRGEPGYKAWKGEVERVNEARKAYILDWLEDYKRRMTDG